MHREIQTLQLELQQIMKGKLASDVRGYRRKGGREGGREGGRKEGREEGRKDKKRS